MKEKTLGYFLLFLGIGIILLAALRVYVVFDTEAEPMQIIDQQSNIGFDMNIPGGPLGQDMKVPVQLGQLQPILSLVNHLVYLIFMGFMASIGYKIAMIGVNLIRPIVVKAKSDSPSK
jgi:hypothetical protein